MPVIRPNRKPTVKKAGGNKFGRGRGPKVSVDRRGKVPMRAKAA